MSEYTGRYIVRFGNVTYGVFPKLAESSTTLKPDRALIYLVPNRFNDNEIYN